MMLLIKKLAKFSKTAYCRLFEKFICVNYFTKNKQLTTKTFLLGLLMCLYENSMKY